jgi:dynein heavy chain
MQAIRGEVVVTGEIMDSINAVFDARVPKLWLYSPAGDELSWMAPNLGLWYSGLISRDAQYRTWLNDGRLNSFWMAGFFNPQVLNTQLLTHSPNHLLTHSPNQGFLTAVQQEIARSHKGDSWALDSVVMHSEVTDISTAENVKHAPREGTHSLI